MLGYGFIDYDGERYYADPTTGEVAFGFLSLNDNSYFFDTYDFKMKRGLFEYDGNYYFANEDGILQTGMVDTGEGYYYFDSESYSALSGLLVLDNETYYFDPVTKKRASGVTLVEGKYYFFGIKYGKKMYGWINHDGVYYYADPTTGELATDWTVVDGQRYFFGLTTKKMMKGWVTYPDTNVVYYLDPETGIGVTGWRDVDGYMYYFDENSTYVTGNMTIDGRDYFFYENGHMKNNFVTIDGNTYYYFEDGTRANDWATIAGTKYFFNSLGVMIGKNVKKVIDVSSWQGDIDWERVINEGGVDGVILRVAMDAEREDPYLAQNIRELQRLGIPYGIYIYSYAENYNEGVIYAQFTLELMKKYNMNPTMGIFFDLESNGITSYMGTAQYEQTVRGFMDTMASAGYGDLARIYTYKNYAEEVLNSDYLKGLITWIAQYYHYCTYDGNYIGWQYSSTERVPGIEGDVDMSVWFS